MKPFAQLKDDCYEDFKSNIDSGTGNAKAFGFAQSIILKKRSVNNLIIAAKLYYIFCFNLTTSLVKCKKKKKTLFNYLINNILTGARPGHSYTV